VDEQNNDAYLNLQVDPKGVLAQLKGSKLIGAISIFVLIGLAMMVFLRRFVGTQITDYFRTTYTGGEFNTTAYGGEFDPVAVEYDYTVIEDDRPVIRKSLDGIGELPLVDYSTGRGWDFFDENHI